MLSPVKVVEIEQNYIYLFSDWHKPQNTIGSRAGRDQTASVSPPCNILQATKHYCLFLTRYRQLESFVDNAKYSSYVFKETTVPVFHVDRVQKQWHHISTLYTHN